MAKAKKRANAGNSKAEVAARCDRFVKAYIANGGNATQAAIEAGYSKKTAYSAGGRLLKRVEIATAIEKNRELASAKAGLTVERTLKEVARLAYSDPRKFYDVAGNLIPIHKLDDDTAACIASLEVDEITSDGAVLGHTKKIKHWDKNAALEKAMKHLGLYEKNNEQIGESLALHVAFGGK